MKNSFTKKETAEILDITPRTIHFYTDEGLIIPEKANPVGRGKTRKYSRRNLIEFLIIRELAKNGLTLEKIKNVMNEMRKRYDESFINPEGAWGKKENVNNLKLIIYDAGGEKPLIVVTWKRKVAISKTDYSSAIVIKAAHFFEKIKDI